MSNSSGLIWPAIARILAIICAGFFILTALSALVLFNVERRAFNPATYKRALLNEGFYKQFPLFLGNLLSTDIGQDAPSFVQGMSAEQWSTLISGLLPVPQLQAMTEDSINQLFAYLNGETENPQIATLPLKQSLNSPAGVDAVLNIVQSLPPCTVEQVAKLLSSSGQKLCNPPREVLDLVRPFIRTQLQITAAAIPDEMPLDFGATQNETNSGIRALRAIRLMMRLSPLLPLGLLLLITALVVRSLRGWLAWWGWPFALTGLPGILVGITGAPLFTLMMERVIAKHMNPSTPLLIIETIRRVIGASAREMLKPVIGESLALLMMGLAMIVVSFYLSRREKQRIVVSEATTQIF